MNAAPDMALLAELRGKGLRLAPLDGGRVHVAPRERLTAELRARILDCKPALLAALEAERLAALDLARRVREMAARWQYSPDELVWALEAAERDSAGWHLCCAADEELCDNVKRESMRFPT